MPTQTQSPLKTYLDHLERGELAYQFSPAANRAVFYPRVLCPFTGSDRLEWRVSAGAGTVHATTVVHPPEGGPFNVALIDCDEGFRLMSRVEDIPPTMAAPPRLSPLIACPPARTPDTAESDLGKVADEMSPLDLMAQGTQRALADCGASLKDVDGLFCATAQARLSVLALAEYLGLQPAYIGSTIVGGSSFEYHVAHAAAAIALGLCNVAVVAYGSTQRSIGRRQASMREINPYETPFRPFMPSSAYALAASRHMHQYGTTREQLAAVAVAAREWALLNPVAWEKKPLTIQEVLNARMVSYPFTVRDICLVTDGGGAIVLASAERARSFKKPPVYVLGCGQSITHNAISSMPDLTVTGAVASGKEAYAMAKLGPADVDAVELYDAFTLNTMLFLEDLGFCKKGEGGAFVSDGRIGPKGSLPVNTNGGGLSYCHPGMYGLFVLIEAVRQLRGECGARQAAKHDVAMVHGNGGVLSAQASVILGSAATA